MKIGLALGGGGARGLAHIGILEIFEEYNIEVDLITGTSMGAVIGASYCLEKDVNWVREEMFRLIQGKELVNLERLSAPTPQEEKVLLVEGLITFVKELYLWNMRAIKKWLVDNSKIGLDIEKLVKGKTFKDLMVPFYAIACDLNTGKEIILSEGILKEALLASIAIPGVFNPIQKDGMFLVDGGIVSLVPVEACRKKGADFIVAVNVTEQIFPRPFTNGMEVIFQSDLITQNELNRVKLREADLIIEPDVKEISWAQFSAWEKCIEKGRQAAKSIVHELKRAIRKKERRLEKKGLIKKILSFGK